jgi:hypothetical protein
MSAENALADRVFFLTILQGIQCEREHGEHELRDIVTSGYDSRTEQRSGEFTLFTLFTWQFQSICTLSLLSRVGTFYRYWGLGTTRSVRSKSLSNPSNLSQSYHHTSTLPLVLSSFFILHYGDHID